MPRAPVSLTCSAVAGSLALLARQRAWVARQDGKHVYVIRHGTAVHNVRFGRKDEVFRDLIEKRGRENRDNRWLFPEIEEWAYIRRRTVDTELVESGVHEARQLGEAWMGGRARIHDRQGATEVAPLAMNDIDLIVTSPLTRTLQTTMEVFFVRDAPQRAGSGPAARWQRSRSESSRPQGGLQADTEAADKPIIALDMIKEWSQGRHTPNLRKDRSRLAQAYPAVDFAHLDSDRDQMWRSHWGGDPNGLEPRAHLEARVARFKQWLAKRPERNIAVVSHGTFLGNLLFGTFIEDTNDLAHCKIYRFEMGA
ncbi:unnamed protein product [Prorocentrum cordatum]|uniref:Phosphoglycerate mutase-like protein n=1 Tax=Prorocentrum cordatum TaxID=2364126 RepID=A0ABN9QPE5_9DINO|nr:unnamed protein product [Polarella glacialis]